MVRGSPGEVGRGSGARGLTSLLAGAFRLAWEAAPRVVGTSIALQVVVGAATAVQLLVAKTLLAEVLRVDRGSADLSDALPWLAALVVLTTLLGLATVVQGTLSMVLTESIGRRATAGVLDVAVSVEPIVYEDPAFHDLLERARTSAGSRPAMAVNGLLGLLAAVAGAIGIGVAVLALDPLLVPLALVSAVPAWLASTTNSRRFHRFTQDHTTSDRRRSYLLHVLTNRDLVKEVRVYGMAPELRRRHDDLHLERLDRIRALARSRRLTALGAAVGGAVGLLASLVYLFWSVDRGRIDLASAGTALFALMFLANRLRGLVASAGTLYEAALFIDDVERFKELSAPGIDGDGASAPLPAFDILEARDLSFTYPGRDRPALDGVDVTLRRGEAIALVGENGSGKTTLAKLLTGLYRPTGGELRWDDVDLTTLEPARLRRSCAVVFQDLARFQVTAHDNVALGDPERLSDRAGVERAGADAGADEVVAELPLGWDQLLSKLFEGGVDLSGGQWQRLALARALFRQVPFVVMDEPSAALDARAEAHLFERIKEVAAGRTVLFISHRFSTVRLADRIYVLHAGRVVESGSHAELLELDGRYAELYRLQVATLALEA